MSTWSHEDTARLLRADAEAKADARATGAASTAHAILQRFRRFFADGDCGRGEPSLKHRLRAIYNSCDVVRAFNATENRTVDCRAADSAWFQLPKAERRRVFEATRARTYEFVDLAPEHVDAIVEDDGELDDRPRRLVLVRRSKGVVETETGDLVAGSSESKESDDDSEQVDDLSTFDGSEEDSELAVDSDTEGPAQASGADADGKLTTTTTALRCAAAWTVADTTRLLRAWEEVIAEANGVTVPSRVAACERFEQVSKGGSSGRALDTIKKKSNALLNVHDIVCAHNAKADKRAGRSRATDWFEMPNAMQRKCYAAANRLGYHYVEITRKHFDMISRIKAALSLAEKRQDDAVNRAISDRPPPVSTRKSTRRASSSPGTSEATPKSARVIKASNGAVTAAGRLRPSSRRLSSVEVDSTPLTSRKAEVRPTRIVEPSEKKPVFVPWTHEHTDELLQAWQAVAATESTSVNLVVRAFRQQSDYEGKDVTVIRKFKAMPNTHAIIAAHDASVGDDGCKRCGEHARWFDLSGGQRRLCYVLANVNRSHKYVDLTEAHFHAVNALLSTGAEQQRVEADRKSDSKARQVIVSQTRVQQLGTGFDGDDSDGDADDESSSASSDLNETDESFEAADAAVAIQTTSARNVNVDVASTAANRYFDDLMARIRTTASHDGFDGLLIGTDSITESEADDDGFAKENSASNHHAASVPHKRRRRPSERARLAEAERWQEQPSSDESNFDPTDHQKKRASPGQLKRRRREILS